MALLGTLTTKWPSPLVTRLSPLLSRPLSAKAELKTTGLIKFHEKYGARLEPFAGFLMPINYKRQTVTSEHNQTRDSASVFDVSHMMQVVISGKDRNKFLESITVADLESLPQNRCTLSVFTNDSGGIIDDCIIGKRPDHLYIVSNAANADKVWSLFESKRGSHDLKTELKREEQKCLIALQGPKAAVELQELVDSDLSKLEFMSVDDFKLKDIGPCQITRCGYTGEDGFEISIDISLAESLVDTLCGTPLVKPAGLGARNTLRLEAGLCLHGHDITEKTTPVEAGLNWVVAKRRRTEGGFPGSEIILKQLKENSKTKRSGLIAVGDGPPAREGSEVVDENQRENLGTITSGSFAPSIRQNIAMAYLPTDLSRKYGHTVLCRVRGKEYQYKITKMPFVTPNYYTRKDS